MSSHIGVSCDSCLKTNFSDRRYKCLICDNYDLCGSCYDLTIENQTHLNTHPMQCILTKTAYELFYAGESIPYQTIVSLTCPYCGLSGFITHTLLIHCLEKHSIISSDNKISHMCPICVINPLQGYQSRFVSLADHIAREHDDEDSSYIHIEKFEDKKDEEDEDEDLPLYVLAERLFIKEENRRQDATRQRLTQTIDRNDYNSVLNGNTASQQRSNSRQSNIRGSRGDIRGHFNNYPYGTVSRTTTGSFRIPLDTTMENTISSDPYTAILFSQDPLFDLDSPFSDITIAPFFLTSSVPIHIPSLQSTTNDRIIQKKSILSNTKQKRSHHIPQQSTQPIISTEPSTFDYQFYQQNISSSFNNPNFPTNPDTIIENNNKTDYSSKSSVNDSRSLLGNLLKLDHNNESMQILSEKNHPSFIQSLLLSSMNISMNK